MKERFIKLPSDRARVWDGLSWFQRAVGSELFRAFQETEHLVGENWERVVFGALVVSGEERGNVARALRKLIDVGVLIVEGGRLQLLYSERSFKTFHSGSGRGPVTVDSGSGPAPLGVQSGSGDVPLPVHSASSARDDSDHVSQRDREIERETERKKGNSEDGGQVPLSGVQLSVAPAGDSKPRKPRKVDEAKAALKQALKDAYASSAETTPVVTGVPLERAAVVVREAIEKGLAPDCETAARRMVASARAASGSWPWKLVNASAGGRAQNGLGKRMHQAPGTTGKDFADAESVEVQLERQGMS